MLNKFNRYWLRFFFNKVYGGENIKTLMDEINAETWIGAQIETGGHALSVLKPIGEYEMISISCAITGRKTADDNAVRSQKLDFWRSNWVS